MAYDFPALPTVGQVYSGYRFNGVAWDAVDSGGGGGAQVITDDEPPPDANDGDLWWETDTGKFYVRYDDGNSAQWVQPIGAGGATDTPEQILAKLITVDGEASGLDADLLDGMSASFFQPALGYTPVNKAGDTLEGTLTFGDSSLLTSGDIRSQRTAAPTTGVIYLGNTGKYLFYDGTSYQMPAAPLAVGGALSAAGTLTLTAAANYISLVDTDESATRHIHHNGGMIGFLSSGGGWILRVTDNGALWSAQFGDFNTYWEGRCGAHQDAAVNRSVTQSRMAGYVEYEHTSGTIGATATYAGYVVTASRRVNSDNYLFGFRQPQLYIANIGWFAAFPF